MLQQTILIIDETPDHRIIFSRLLRAAGFRVLETAPGDDALALACRSQPDLIVAGLSLPGQPAWETARLLGSTPALAGTPILAATIYNTLISWPRVRAIGCSDYVNKPFDFDDLLRRIRALLPEPSSAALAA